MKRKTLAISLILAASLGLAAAATSSENTPGGVSEKKRKKRTHPVSPRKSK